jgi:ATP-dependent Zn protease
MEAFRPVMRRTMGPRVRSSALSAVAHHEAGHGLAAAHWVGTVKDVSIIPDAHHRGRVRVRPSESLHDPERILAHARFYVAGWAAEWLYRGRLPPDAWSHTDLDAECARALVDVLGVESTAYVLQCEYQRTCCFLTVNWRIVRAVAAALLTHGRLGEYEFYSLLDALPEMEDPICL